jgi:uncharacterized membrane protein YjgN (DUF898 family)
MIVSYQQPYPPQQPQVYVQQFAGNQGGYPGGRVPSRAQIHQFAFDGGAATYFGTAVLGILITVLTLGICYPFAVVLHERWRAKHSYIEGRQLVFTGTAWALFGNWLKWWLLVIVTVGIYSFWVVPRLHRWKWENTSWAHQLYR